MFQVLCLMFVLYYFIYSSEETFEVDIIILSFQITEMRLLQSNYPDVESQKFDPVVFL